MCLNWCVCEGRGRESGKMSVGAGNLQPGKRQRSGCRVDRNSDLFRNVADQQKRALKLQIWS